MVGTPIGPVNFACFISEHVCVYVCVSSTSHLFSLASEELHQEDMRPRQIFASDFQVKSLGIQLFIVAL